MKAPKCGYENQILEASGRGTIEKELLDHLSECPTCREVAVIVEDIRARLHGVEPGSGLRDEAERLWYVSRSLPPAVSWRSVRGKLLFVRGLSLVAPLLVAIVILRERLTSSTPVTDVTRILRSGLDSLPVDATLAFAGALFVVTAIAVVRLALSD
jgi:hypothetical protein